MRYLNFRTFSILLVNLSFFIQTANLISQDSVPGDFCIRESEYKLYNLINDYRKAMNLGNIPLSNSLSFVARQHAIDLVDHHPDTNTCNFHSWSDKGSWKACCYEKDIRDKSCMTGKPAELTKYRGKAYEIIYWENSDATPERAFDQWREIAAARSVITNFKEWESYQWLALGVAIHKGFAIAWFGVENDPESQIKICESGKVISIKPEQITEEKDIVTTATNRSYLIFGSFSSLDDAKVELKKYRDEGFKRAKIVSKDEKFRISLADYADPQLAEEAKKELPSKFKNAWILTY